MAEAKDVWNKNRDDDGPNVWDLRETLAYRNFLRGRPFDAPEDDDDDSGENKPRQPDPSAIAVRCELPRKELLVEAAPDRFFDDDHYRGFPAVLVRLAAVDEPELADLLEGAHRLRLAIKPRTPRKRRRRS